MFKVIRVTYHCTALLPTGSREQVTHTHPLPLLLPLNPTLDMVGLRMDTAAYAISLDYDDV